MKKFFKKYGMWFVAAGVGILGLKLGADHPDTVNQGFDRTGQAIKSAGNACKDAVSKAASKLKKTPNTEG
jgi:hypothetical protein